MSNCPSPLIFMPIGRFARAFMIGFRTTQYAYYCFLHVMTSNRNTRSSLFVGQDGGGQEVRFGGKKRQNNSIKSQENVDFSFFFVYFFVFYSFN